MTSVNPPPATLNAQTAAIAASSPSGTSSPAVPAARSYANATRAPSTGPNSSASPVVVGGSAQANHGKSNSVSPVNGKPIAPAVPAVANSNGIMNQGDHSRKSSVTISASGVSGMLPNGGPVGPTGRPPMVFGAINANSPAMTNSVPHQPQQNTLPTPRMDPRVLSPAASPSPIPQPQPSGGRPPANFQGQGNGLNFGSFGGENADQNARPPQMPGAPLTPSQQPVHLRRESSQSAHSEVGGPGMPPYNRGYPASRGRGSYQGFQPQMPHSPVPNFRSLHQQRPGQNMPPQFQGQMQNVPGSPYRAPRSPALTSAAPQMHMQNSNPAMQHPPYGYPQHHLQPQHVIPHSPYAFPVISSSACSSQLSATSLNSPINNQRERYTGSEDSAISLASSPNLSSLPVPDLSPASGGYERYLTLLKTQGLYGYEAQYDPRMGYYPPFIPNPPMHYNQGPPPSPRPFNAPHAGQPAYMHPYTSSPHSQGMSRTPSQMSERPASSLGQPQTPGPNASVPVAHTPSQAASTPATSNFTIPARTKSKAVLIKDASGNVLDFNKPAASTASPAPSRPPMVVSTPTPPPAAPAAAELQHTRSESKVTKTSADIKAEFEEQVKRRAEADKQEEEAKQLAQEKAEAEAQAAKEKEEAEAKAAQEKQEAEAKAAQEKAEEEARLAKEKEEAEKAAAEAQAAKEAEEAEKERLAKEEEERMIAEMEEQERLDEERERAYQEKKQRELEEKKRKEAEEKAAEDERLRQAEREAEAAEEAKSAQKGGEPENEDEKQEREKLFASLKRPAFGPGANQAAESGTATPASDDSMPPPPVPKPTGTLRNKPAALKLETKKPVEPAQPTPGMQALKSARFLKVNEETVKYPEGILSPNPALNQVGKRNGRQYNKEFLLQFQEVFKEKPSVDWENKVKETLGDSSDSAVPKSARTPMMGPRQPSARGNQPSAFSGPMGTFSQAGRTLPPGTTSQERFMASQRPSMTNPLASFAGRPGGFPVGGPPVMSRTNSLQTMGQGAPHSPRTGSTRGKGSRRGGLDKAPSRRDDEQAAKTMPLTAGQDVKPLQASGSGWKPTSLVPGPSAPRADPTGLMAPDMVQRKVKAALNKMTPEKFDKISDQILEIAAQSKHESDGRTLRQVIALTFEKACDEAHWAAMYAKFCERMLRTISDEIKDDSVVDKSGNPIRGGNLFRKYLLNRCQEEFEKGWEVNLPPKEEGETQEVALMSDEYYIAAAAKRKGLGLVQFIGELYKLGMLTMRIMHTCVYKLLNYEGAPDEAAIESLTKLLRTIGPTMENSEKGPEMVKIYFDRIADIVSKPDLPSRLKFMLMDVQDLRRAGWKSKDDAKGPKTIQEIHEEAQALAQKAEAERMRQNQRPGPGGRLPTGRGDSRSFSQGGMMPPQDYKQDRVEMNDLRKLTKGAQSRNVSQGPTSLGPNTSMFASRSSSGRRNLGPMGILGRDQESGTSSRTGTPPMKEKEKEPTSTNAFSALAALDASGETADDVTSPPSAPTSPPEAKAQPASQEANGEAKME